MQKTWMLFLLVISGISTLWSQEFNLEVNVNAPALKTADPKTIPVLERAIADFFNSTTWTDDTYEAHEKIEGTIQINIKDDPTANSFVADMYITTARPVYGSNYSSPMINHVDKDIRFTYSELDPLRDSRSSYSDAFSSLLTYYAYVMLGFDYDSFSPEGGDPYFNIANSVLASVPATVTGSDKAWTAQSSENARYWIVENALSPRIKRFRRALYDYHRRGLDKMETDASLSKAIILGTLKELLALNEAYPNTTYAKLFANAKRAEVLEIFKNSIKPEQRQVYDIFVKVDPAQSAFMKELR